MCTHLLLEAEGLADQVVVLDDGRDLVRGAPAELTRRFWPSAIVRVDAEDRAGAAAALRGADGVARRRAPTRAATARCGSSVDDHARVPELVFAPRRRRRAGHAGRAVRAVARGPLLHRAGARADEPRASGGR